jgi:hypothetical protein
VVINQEMTKEKRLSELQGNEIITDAEMNELMDLSPNGEIKNGPNLFTLGIKNLEIFIENLNEGSIISEQAFEQGFYIETISLRLQHIELYLRMFVVVKNKKGKIIDSETDKRTFGNFINECDTLGFDKTLIAEMKDFNEYRIIAIHKYLLGEIRHSDLKEVCIRTKGLDARIREYVFIESFH